MFFMALFNRGGGSTGVDVSALQSLVDAQGLQIAELFLLENGNATGAVICTLMARITALEKSLQSFAPVTVTTRYSIPIPESVAVPLQASDDLRKLIEAEA
ncbi:hypothetical protein CFB43_06605 [Burkholderia sp. AU15512]|nr:hypothetical protein CFB43_06605 [Burkholderia sp. AU15512]